MEKIQNLLKFTEFDKNWKSRRSKNNKRTTTGLDIIEKKSFDEDDDEILDGEVIDNEDMEDIDNMDTNIDDDIDDDDIDDDDDDDIDDDDDDDMDDDDMDDWKMKLTSVIEDIIGDADASIEEIVDFINQEFVDDLEDDDDDLEDDDDDDDDLEDDDDDLEDDDDDLEDESIDDDEGEDITESFRRFKRR